MTSIMSDFWSLAFSFPTGQEGIELAIVEALSEALKIMMLALNLFGRMRIVLFSHEMEDFVSAFETNKSLDEMRQHCNVRKSIRRNLDCR